MKKRVKKPINNSKDYINSKVVQYMLNKAFPNNRRIDNFYHLRNDGLYLPNDLIFRVNDGASAEVEAEKVYYETRLFKQYPSRLRTESVSGQIKEVFFHIATAKFISKVFLKQIKDAYLSNGKWAYMAIPLMAKAVIPIIAPFIVANLPLLIAGVSLVVLATALVGAYQTIYQMKNEYMVREQKYFEFEAELIEEYKSKEVFEREYGVRDLVNYLTTKEALIHLKENMSADLRKKIDELYSSIERDDRVSEISKSVILAMINFGSDAGSDYYFQKKLEKIPSSMRHIPEAVKESSEVIKEVAKKIESIQKRISKGKELKSVNEIGITDRSIGSPVQEVKSSENIQPSQNLSRRHSSADLLGKS